MSQKIKLKYNISSWDASGLNFWGITKSGNTSVKLALISIRDRESKSLGGTEQWAHSEKMANYITPDEALENGNYNFSVTRHPFDRFVSMYKDALNRRNIYGFSGHSIDDFIEYVKKRPDSENNIHVRSQSYFIGDNNIETIDLYDTDRIEELLGVPISKANPSEGFAELNEKQKQIVYSLYEKDFERLGYEYR